MSQKSLSSTVQFASIDQAQILLSEEDNFTASWSQFDVDSRLQNQQVPVKNYLSSSTHKHLAGPKKSKRLLGNR